MNDMRRYMDATNKLNESPVGWAKDKLAKATSRIGSKVTFGGTKQRMNALTDNRTRAAKLLKVWNKKYAAQDYQRTPKDIMAFLKQELKMDDQQIEAAWNDTYSVIKNFGKYDEVTKSGIKAPGPEQPGERRVPGSPADKPHNIPSGLTAGPADKFESLDEAPGPGPEKMSTDAFRDLLVSAIDVKNKATAQAELDKGEGPGDADKDEPEQDPDALKATAAAGGKDMDGDGNYDWDDLAMQAQKRGETGKALDSIIDTIDPKMKELVKRMLKGEIR